ncbi:hypothetical protein [Pseudomonas syringae]|uniref:hypothetical protein n=1 Tax=Pseudomonas syringae TaxID=317 RepID=UPI001F1D6E25|nr:hypothetical protein [Pseudomonas syringae]MCF5371939.1 hypothetical protein [Pseudomonas syringae]MCF5382515.1 hypothetical protein [Pseudomonas syringae]MCF5419402.1 hypothetical protein [Pseudomonas syringae]MCF5451949.1 hypothetical protein [Pseudomonas syringae]MCF5458733.1 hypothetical protein [Pseudomonas syringae]
MKRNPMDEAISALKVAPVQTVGTFVSALIAFYLFSTESEWFSVALMASVIFTAILWRATPQIIQAANKRAEARHRYPH